MFFGARDAMYDKTDLPDLPYELMCRKFKCLDIVIFGSKEGGSFDERAARRLSFASAPMWRMLRHPEFQKTKNGHRASKFRRIRKQADSKTGTGGIPPSPPTRPNGGHPEREGNL